ncbi:SDR family oxidoreductase [Actinoplanes solisilvae]|uniref:SDR family oxidoreductase n=1 Tax=Actinoplanes solisilvae TaxID=2486853 RepID=UPI000FD8B0CF|nr:NAD(P)H-binding protein [Actinoplanes solisilvae]
MKIAVIGGTGLIGSRVVGILKANGHDAVAHSRATGVDLRSGQGVPQALKGADVVVNLTKPEKFDESALVFFRETMENLLLAAEDAEVGHLVILSIVGAEKVPDLVYYQARVLQEKILEQSDIPYSIVRSTQFFEFIETVLSWTSDDTAVRLPAVLMQPIAAADVARTVAAVAVTGPLEETRNIAGPEVHPLDNLGRMTLAARGDERPVITDPDAGFFSVANGVALIADESTLLTETTFRHWLTS